MFLQAGNVFSPKANDYRNLEFPHIAFGQETGKLTTALIHDLASRAIAPNA
jgi:hypothetical protein